MVAREVGPSFVQAYTSCNIEYAIPTPKVMIDAREVEADRYGFEEIMTDDARAYLDHLKREEKKAKSAE